MEEVVVMHQVCELFKFFVFVLVFCLLCFVHSIFHFSQAVDVECMTTTIQWNNNQENKSLKSQSNSNVFLQYVFYLSSHSLFSLLFLFSLLLGSFEIVESWVIECCQCISHQRAKLYWHQLFNSHNQKTCSSHCLLWSRVHSQTCPLCKVNWNET